MQSSHEKNCFAWLYDNMFTLLITMCCILGYDNVFILGYDNELYCVITMRCILGHNNVLYSWL
jgi:hypothetical protein